MSISNLFVPNTYSLYSQSLTSEDITATNLTVTNLTLPNYETTYEFNLYYLDALSEFQQLNGAPLQMTAYKINNIIVLRIPDSSFTIPATPVISQIFISEPLAQPTDPLQINWTWLNFNQGILKPSFIAMNGANEQVLYVFIELNSDISIIKFDGIAFSAGGSCIIRGQNFVLTTDN